MIETLKRKEQIKRLLNLDEIQYGNLLMDKAYEYLNQVMRVDSWGEKILTSCPMFWKWWVNQWERTDRIWYYDRQLDNRLYFTDSQRMKYRELYENMHSEQYMNLLPNRLVMEESYAIMVGEMIDNNNK